MGWLVIDLQRGLSRIRLIVRRVPELAESCQASEEAKCRVRIQRDVAAITRYDQSVSFIPVCDWLLNLL